jgi:hypothetical protein
MLKTLIALLALTVSSAAFAASTPPASGSGEPQAVVKDATVAKQAAQAARIANKYVIMCYTCGGNYSHKARDVPLGGTNNVWEWGAGCGGSQTWRRDGNPYMCYH